MAVSMLLCAADAALWVDSEAAVSMLLRTADAALWVDSEAAVSMLLCAADAALEALSRHSSKGVSDGAVLGLLCSVSCTSRMGVCDGARQVLLS